jgi:hypothetical protein
VPDNIIAGGNWVVKSVVTNKVSKNGRKDNYSGFIGVEFLTLQCKYMFHNI